MGKKVPKKRKQIDYRRSGGPGGSSDAQGGGGYGIKKPLNVIAGQFQTLGAVEYAKHKRSGTIAKAVLAKKKVVAKASAAAKKKAAKKK